MMKKMHMDNNCNLLSVCTVGGRDNYDSVPIQLINFTLSSHRKDRGREIIQGVGTRDLWFPLLAEFSKCKPKSCLPFFNLSSEILHCQPPCGPLHGDSYVFMHTLIYSVDTLRPYHEASMESDRSRFEPFQNQEESAFR